MDDIDETARTDARACSDGFVVRFILTSGTSSFSGSNAGLHRPPPTAFFEILESAQSTPTRDPNEAISIPFPRDGDHGTFNTSADFGITTRLAARLDE